MAKDDRPKNAPVRLAAPVRRKVDQILEDIALFDVAVGPAYFALTYLLFPLLGAVWGGSFALALPISDEGVAKTIAFPICAGVGAIVAFVLAFALRRLTIFNRRLGIVGIFLVAVFLCSGVGVFGSFKSAAGWGLTPYKMCVSLQERGSALPPSCEEVLKTPPAQRSLSRVGSFAAGMCCWGFTGCFLLGVLLVASGFLDNLWRFLTGNDEA